MVRLIRLASVDNCNFRTSFGNDIKIEPGSKLAVLNATFETDVSEITIQKRNREIKFTPAVDGGVVFDNTTTFLPNRTYSGELGVTQFWQDMGQTLSNTLTYRNTLFDSTMNPGGAKINAGVFSEFEMRYEEYNKEFPIPRNPVEFIYTYSPMLSPLGPTFAMSFPQGSRNSALIEDRALYDPDAPARFIWSGTGGVADQAFANQLKQVDSQNNANVGTKVRMSSVPGVVMSKGNGLWMARISFLADNSSGLQDNGFGIGLSRGLFGVPDDEDIPKNMIHGEIRVNRPGEGYRFRFNGGDEQTSALTPRRYNGTDPTTDHDIMWLRVGKDESSPVGTGTYGKYCLQGGVWQDVGATGLETVLFSYELKNYFNQYDFLHPYLFINGIDDTCEIDATAFTPSVTHAMQINEISNPNPIWDPVDPLDPFKLNFGNREYKITNILKNGNGTGYPPTVIGNIVPQVDENRFNGGSAFTRETKLQLHADVLKYLGFGRSFTGYSNISQKMGMANLQFENFIEYLGTGGPDLDNDDNFIVESLTLPVDSYDASEQYYGDGDPFKDVGLTDSAERLGRRKNIIATIPATNINEIVNYEASTPQFIDLRNTSTLNERNLEFRILDKDFNPVETGNKKSILTLLLSGPGER